MQFSFYSVMCYTNLGCVYSLYLHLTMVGVPISRPWNMNSPVSELSEPPGLLLLYTVALVACVGSCSSVR